MADVLAFALGGLCMLLGVSVGALIVYVTQHGVPQVRPRRVSAEKADEEIAPRPQPVPIPMRPPAPPGPPPEARSLDPQTAYDLARADLFDAGVSPDTGAAWERLNAQLQRDRFVGSAHEWLMS